MKKIVVGLILIITIIGIGSYQYLASKNEVSTKEKQIKNTNMLTMMLETESGTGIYEEATQSEWPLDGYVFNENLSKCENGGTVTYNEETQKINMKTNISDKCYIYFDIKKELTFAEYIINEVYTEDGVNGLYYHDGIGSYTNASEEAGDNSYRYSGANPNNYLCFGSDAATCPNDNLYRIIGLFDDDQDGKYNIKLIKNSSIGDYEWDDGVISFENSLAISNKNDKYNVTRLNDILAASDVCNGSNEWATADLNYYLNNDKFLNKFDILWQDKIFNNIWQVGGNSETNIIDVTIKNTYQNEIKIPAENTTYTAKIGLMYVSDYGYAASPENWKTNLSSYNNTTNTNNNWLYLKANEWTITRVYFSSLSVFMINFMRETNTRSGSVLSNYVCSEFYSDLKVRPTFYLNSDILFQSGSGTKTHPYRI